jgi:hypothetical protein
MDRSVVSGGPGEKMGRGGTATIQRLAKIECEDRTTHNHGFRYLSEAKSQKTGLAYSTFPLILDPSPRVPASVRVTWMEMIAVSETSGRPVRDSDTEFFCSSVIEREANRKLWNVFSWPLLVVPLWISVDDFPGPKGRRLGSILRSVRREPLSMREDVVVVGLEVALEEDFVEGMVGGSARDAGEMLRWGEILSLVDQSKRDEER